jgi:hypothetical protein
MSIFQAYLSEFTFNVSIGRNNDKNQSVSFFYKHWFLKIAISHQPSIDGYLINQSPTNIKSV